MATQVEIKSAEAGHAGSLGGRLHLSPLADSSNKSPLEPPIPGTLILTPELTKPVPGPKPRLTPKPYMLERNATVRPILAPKPSTKPQPDPAQAGTCKPDLPRTPKPTPGLRQTSKPDILSKPTFLPQERSDSGPPQIEVPQGAEPSGTGEQERAREKPQSRERSIVRAKSMGFLSHFERDGDGTRQLGTEDPVARSVALLRTHPRSPRPRPVSAIFPVSEDLPESSDPRAGPHWAGRRPLSADLTAKFETVGLSLQHRPGRADTKENTPESVAEDDGVPARRKEREKGAETVPSSVSERRAKPTLPERRNDKGDSREDVRTSDGIKRRISLLFDSALLTPTAESSPGSGGEPRSAPPALDANIPMGVKQRIQKLTADLPSAPSPRIPFKPRPLPPDLTKRFDVDQSGELSCSPPSPWGREAPKAGFGGGGTSQPKFENPASDQPMEGEEGGGGFHGLTEWLPRTCHDQPAERTGAGSQGEDVLSTSVQMVRAALFENVVERHSVRMLEQPRPTAPPRRSLSLCLREEELARIPRSLHVEHVVDTLPAVCERKAISQPVPVAQLEDKATSLRSRRGVAAESLLGTEVEGRPASVQVPKAEPRILRVGALQKWAPESNREMLEGKEKERQIEKEKEQQIEQEKERQRKVEQEKERQIEQEKERQVEQEKERQVELEKERQREVELEKERQRQVELEKEKQQQIQRQIEVQKERLRWIEQEKERQREIQRQVELEKERLRQTEMEKERLRQTEMEKERLRQVEMEKERLRQVEMEKERLRQVEREKERLRQIELEKERLRQVEREKERLRQIELEKERLRQIEMEKERLRQTEMEKERLRQVEMEKERLRQVEREKERLRQIELEKERLRQVEREKERLRQIELEKERLRQIELEKERLRQIELEKERLRQIALEKERQREIQKQVELEKERLRQISMEKERLRQIAMEKERQREIQKQVELDKKRLRQVEMEKDRQWQKDSERQTEEEKEKQKQKKTELENKRLQETERQKEVERERQREQQWKKLSEMEREDAGAPKRLKMLEAEEQLFRPRATYFALTGQIQESTLLGESIDGPELPFTDSSAGSGKWSSQRRVTTLRRNPSLDAAFRGGGVAVWTEEAELKGEQARERERGTGARSLKESAVDLAAELENPRQKLLELQRHTEEELERQKLREANMELEGQLELHGQKEKADGQWQAWPGRSEKGREPEGAPMQEAGRRLRPQVLDVDTVSLRDRHSTGSPSGSWRQPSVGPEGLYHMAVLDVDSFRSQKVLGADVRDLSTTPRPQPTLHGQAGVPPRTTGRTDLMWTPCHLELWGQAEEKPSMVLTPLPPSKSPGSWLAPDPPPKVAHKANLEQLLQRHPERLPKPVQAPEQCRSGVSAEASVPEAHSPGRLARASPEHSLWALETAVERGGVQRRQNLQAKDVSRMRSRSVSRRPAPAESSLDGPLSRMRSRSAHRESGRQTWEQLKRCTSSEAEGKDTDTLVHETDSQYGTWETGLHTEDSLTPATPTSDSILSSSSRKPTPPHTPGEARSPDPHQEAELLPFPETSTTLLDSSALRSRVQLSKKRSRRTLPSRSARHSATLSMLQEGVGEPGQDWMYRDSTEEKAEPSNQDDSDSEEPLRPSEPRLSSSQPQRVALFPGMDPSALKAQLKKRGDTDDQTNGPAPTQLSRSPKSPFLSRASRVLPPAAGKENEEESSPQWLKELKSKKRLSQYEHEA